MVTRKETFGGRLLSAYFAAMFLLLLAFPNGARAQVPSTVTQTVFTNASCASTLDSANLRNIGQIGHSFSFSAASPGSNLQVRIQGSADGTNWFQISNDAQAQPGIIVGVGAYPFLRIQVTNGGAGCTISGTYVGSSAATTVNVAASNAQFMYQRNAMVNLAANADQSVTGVVPPYGNAAGFIVFSYLGAAGPAGSTLTVDCPDSLTGTLVQVAQLSPATAASTAQVLSVPNFACSSINVEYVFGGASTATFSADYYFTYPGMAPIITPPSAVASDPCQSSGVKKQSAAINITAAGTTQIVALASGQTVYPCGFAIDANVSSSSTESFQWEYGTGSNCGTGTTALSGAMLAGAATGTGPIPLSFSGPGTIMSVPAANAVCLNVVQVAGTVINVQGVLSYVRQ